MYLLFRLEKSPVFKVFSAFLPVYEALGTSCHRLFFLWVSHPDLPPSGFMFGFGGGTYWSLAPRWHLVAHSILSSVQKCLPHVICREESPCKGRS